MDAEGQAAVRVVLREVFQAELQPLGFERHARSKVWLRHADGLEHAVSIEGRSGWITIRWDVVCPPVGAILHGKLPQPHEVAYSGVIAGTPQPALEAGVKSGASSDELRQDLGAAIGGMQLGVRQVVRWLGYYPSRDGAIEELLSESTPGERPFVIVPSSQQLRLFTAAAFAAVGRDPRAVELVELAVAGSAPWKGGITDERNVRLRAALAH